MNVASLELCKELYELTSWGIDDYSGQVQWWQQRTSDGECAIALLPHSTTKDIPAYDLGYLLRKLKPYLREQDATQQLMTFNLMLSISIGPEDALAKLAIKLFKQGILNRV